MYGNHIHKYYFGAKSKKFQTTLNWSCFFAGVDFIPMILLLKCCKPCEFEYPPPWNSAPKFTSHSRRRFQRNENHILIIFQLPSCRHSLSAPSSQLTFWSTAFFSCSIHCLTLEAPVKRHSSSRLGPFTLEKFLRTELPRIPEPQKTRFDAKKKKYQDSPEVYNHV